MNMQNYYMKPVNLFTKSCSFVFFIYLFIYMLSIYIQDIKSIVFIFLSCMLLSFCVCILCKFNVGEKIKINLKKTKKTL